MVNDVVGLTTLRAELNAHASSNEVTRSSNGRLDFELGLHGAIRVEPGKLRCPRQAPARGPRGARGAVENFAVEGSQATASGTS